MTTADNGDNGNGPGKQPPPLTLEGEDDHRGIKERITSGMYWTLQPMAPEWWYTVHNLLADYQVHPDLVVFAENASTGNQLVLIAREALPAVALSERFGVDFTRFAPDKIIMLRPAAEQPKEPTVRYWGEA